MSKPILCLDFDGVMHSYTSKWLGPTLIPDPPVRGLFEFLCQASEAFEIHVFSSRSSAEGGIAAMLNWLMYWANIEVAENASEADGTDRYEELQTTLYNVIADIVWDTTKPPAMLTIDDRALTFTGVWPEIETLRNFKPWNKS